MTNAASNAVQVVFDYKSPYTYLALEALYRLEDETRVPFQWTPWNFPIEPGYGTPGTRTVLQENKVRYMYRDARRLAAPRGLTILPPKKLFDTTLAGIGALYAQNQKRFRAYNDRVFRGFWTATLDIEAPAAIETVLREAGVDTSGWAAFVPVGRAQLPALAEQALKDGVFGIPTVRVGKELFWGSDRLDLCRQTINRLAGESQGV